MKSRGLTRSLAFWLNQGASFVLLHSAYEGKDGERSHALMPYFADANAFRWQDSPPLTTMHAFTEALGGAKKLAKVDDLKMAYGLSGDTELAPGAGKTPALMASDAVALLPFQISEKKFAVAAYVVTPNIAVPMKPARMTLKIDKELAGGVLTSHPSTQTKGAAQIVEQGKGSTTMSFDIRDDVTWVIFEVR
jgi:hypothetical protein